MSNPTLTPEQAKAVQGILEKALEPTGILAEYLNAPEKSEGMDGWMVAAVFEALHRDASRTAKEALAAMSAMAN